MKSKVQRNKLKVLNGNMTDVYVPPRSTALLVVESVASIALVIIAIIGNFLILVALYRNPHLRNSTNIYIAALAVTDLLNACIPGTLFASTMVMGRFTFSLTACRLSGFLVHFLTYVSMATMTLTAVNRYSLVQGGKTFCASLLRILYRRLKAGFSVC